MAVYSIPVMLSLAVALWWLPEELDLSGPIKKLVGYIFTLMLVPVFSTMVADVGEGFVNAVDAYIKSSLLLTDAANFLTGLVVTSFVVPSSISSIPGLGALVNLAVFSSASATSAMTLNIFTIAAWVVAALLITATPKIAASFVSGAGGLAEQFIQRAQMGMGGAAAVGLAQGAKGLGGGASALSAYGKKPPPPPPGAPPARPPSGI